MGVDEGGAGLIVALTETKKLDLFRTALLRLSTEEKKSIRDLFGDAVDDPSGWHMRYMRRLLDEQLVLREGNARGSRWVAVDGKFLRRFAESDVVLARWMFEPSQADLQRDLPYGSPPPVAPPSLFPSPPPSLFAPPPQLSLVPPEPPPEPPSSPPAPIEQLPALVEEARQQAQGASPELMQALDQVLKTVLLVADNIIYMRGEIQKLTAKFCEIVERANVDDADAEDHV